MKALLGQFTRQGLKASVLIFSALSLSHVLSQSAFVFELASHFKMLWVPLLTITVLLCAVSGWRKWTLFGLAILSINAWDIGRWYIPRSPEVNSQNTFKILLFNQGLYNNQGENIARWVREHQPDLVMIQEINASTQQALDQLQNYPHRLRHLYTDSRAMALWSRYPLNESARGFMSSDLTSLYATVQWLEHSLPLLAIHTSSANHPATFEPRKREMAELTRYIQEHASPYWLVLGDLNVTLWSGLYRQMIQQTGLYNSRQGFGILPSWPNRYSGWHGPALLRKVLNPLPAPFKRLPIDHCLLGQKLFTQNMRVIDELDWGSDHFPLWIELRL